MFGVLRTLEVHDALGVPSWSFERAVLRPAMRGPWPPVQELSRAAVAGPSME